jgi:hypothetical protein
MKLRYFIFPVLGLSFIGSALAAPTLNVCYVASCVTGYYLSGGVCYPCPTPGTSVDHNTAARGGCYVPANTTATDDSGTYTYSSNCYWIN